MAQIITHTPEKIAADFDLVVVESNNLELQLNIDSHNQYNQYLSHLNSLRSDLNNILLPTLISLGPDSLTCKPGHMVLDSKTPDHYHVYLGLTQPLPQSERINLQFMLGSDPVRESLNTQRLLRTGDAGILLFETPANAQRILWWRGLTQRLRAKTYNS